MTQPDEQIEMRTLLVYLKTLADQTRLRLIGLLATQQRSVDELAALLDLRASTVSWHLAKLKEIDLVEMRVEGNSHLYRLNGKGLGKINRLLGSPERIALLVDADMDAWERKVLADFFENGRLKTIPAQEKKKLVILTWLADRFAWGHTYTEREVNELIARYHPDTASLRRYLVGYRFMEREHGTYWRTHRETPALEELVALAAALDGARRYSEDEINAWLRECRPDHAADALRRDLLAAGLVATSGGRYWRLEREASDVPGEAS